MKAAAKGVYFGSFNAFAKLTPTSINMWVKLLLAIPHSTLYLKAKPLCEKALCEWLWGEFEKGGVDRKRVLLQGWEFEISSHLEQYSKVDIHLDSYPYNGTTTICESLWQGVPVISLAGSSHRSRVGLSLLSQVGLDDCIAQSESEYINIAIEKTSNLGELAKLRGVLRERMRESALVDSARFIEGLEGAYEQMWEEKRLK
jgi:protein O-GlcNAc transferase